MSYDKCCVCELRRCVEQKEDLGLMNNKLALGNLKNPTSA